MAKQPIPPRIKWAVDLMDPQPSDSVLEIGCGPGPGAELICERLETGKLFAIDRRSPVSTAPSVAAPSTSRRGGSPSGRSTSPPCASGQAA
jgi:trans-aconitate methyltransferase